MTYSVPPATYNVVESDLGRAAGGYREEVLRMLDHLRPRYAKDFRCIGPQCEDTCCHGLDVVIDQETYEKYQAPRFESMFNGLEIVKDNPDRCRYARIKLTESWYCPFFSPEKWCGIQQQYGEEYLSETCRSYPRVTRRIDGLLEKALLLSCPEAARLVLLHPQLIPQIPVTDGRTPYEQFLRMEGTTVRTNESPHRFLWEVREFTLLLLCDRKYPLWQRLFILGMFSKRFADLVASSRVALVPDLLRTYAEIAIGGTVCSMMEQMPTQTLLQLTVVMEVVGQHLQLTDPSHVRFRECVRDFLQGIGHVPGASHEALLPAYLRAYETHYQPFMRTHPAILENYLINGVFRTRFPYALNGRGEPHDAYTEFLTMCLHHGVIKGLLIGIAGHYGEAFSTDHCVKLISTFVRVVEHCPALPGPRQLGLDDTNAVAILLKN